MQKYSNRQIFIHWLSAIIIIWATISGFYISWFNVSPQIQNIITLINPVLGSLLIPIFIIRVYFRKKLGVPAYIDEKKVFTGKIAHCVHLLIYITTFLVLITGVLMMEREVNYLNIFTLKPILSNPIVTQFFFTFHVYVCMLLGLLVIMHILGVFIHLLNKQKIMQRMWFHS